MRFHRFVLATLAAASLSVGLSQMATAADMPVKAAPHPIVVAPSWTGFYAGLHVGYGWTTTSTDEIGIDTAFIIPAYAAGALPTSLSPRVKGFVGGGQVGYNWQFGQYVAGLETDVAFSGMRGDAVFSSNVGGQPPLGTTQSNKITWLGTFRPRLGWLWTPSTLIYATGGLAYGGVKAETTIVDLSTICPIGNTMCSAGSVSKTLVGWTVGGGLESQIASNWTARIDYLYFDLGSATYPVTSNNPGYFGHEMVRAEAHFGGHLVRVGFNYKFGGK